MKTYYGAKKSMFFFGRNGKITSPDYTPNETFETDLSEVKYPMPGTDINGLIVAIGQRLGLGEMSVLTAMVMDPAIDDPEEEYARVQVDALRSQFAPFSSQLLQIIVNRDQQSTHSTRKQERSRTQIGTDKRRHLVHGFLA